MALLQNSYHLTFSSHCFLFCDFFVLFVYFLPIVSCSCCICLPLVISNIWFHMWLPPGFRNIFLIIRTICPWGYLPPGIVICPWAWFPPGIMVFSWVWLSPVVMHIFSNHFRKNIYMIALPTAHTSNTEKWWKAPTTSAFPTPTHQSRVCDSSRESRTTSKGTRERSKTTTSGPMHHR